MNDVTVLIPTIPYRTDMLKRAISSVIAQTRQPDNIVIVYDHDHKGAALTRNYGLQQVNTEWVAFLDDDDEFHPQHLQELMRFANDKNDVVYTGCQVLDGFGHYVERRDEWGRYGKAFDGDALRDHSWLPVTSLCRTSLVHAVGGFEPWRDTNYDDWGLYVKMLDKGARFFHHKVITWTWHHHGTNTSGRGDRW